MDEDAEGSLREFAVAVVRRLAGAGHRALFAGGCVRDQLMRVRPKDYDVATSARPEQITELFPRTKLVGVAFGVVRVLGEAPHADAAPFHVEVATFRRESGYSDGRRPDQVEFADEVEDVRRRDFTINGLLFDPLKRQILDYVGGQADLERKLVRAIGQARLRFQEDRLRLLRAVRFAAQLGFEIEGQTFQAIKEESARVVQVSAERIRDELTHMLTGPRPRRAFELMKAAGLLQAILPEVDRMAGVEQPPEFHPEGDVWTHTLIMLGQLERAPPALALGVLLHDVAKPATFERAPDRIRFSEHEKLGAEMAEQILRRLRFGNEVIGRVTELVRWHMLFKDIRHMRPARLKRFLRRDDFEDHLELHRLDCVASHADLESYRFCQAQRAVLPTEQLRPRPLVNGDDLKSLGLQPGPVFRRILRDVEDRQLEGTLADRQKALEYVRRKYVERS
jgi:poly(A) polymerase